MFTCSVPNRDNGTGVWRIRSAAKAEGEPLLEDDAILGAIAPLAQQAAVFAEPAGATAYAGLAQACAAGLVQPDQSIVVINTGSGLKDVAAVMQVTGQPRIIEPTLNAVTVSYTHLTLPTSELA